MRRRYGFLILVLIVCGCGQQPEAPALSDQDAQRGNAAQAPVAAPEGTALESTPTDTPLTLRASGDPAYLTDAAGNALYYLEDNHDGSKCDTACQEVWPPVMGDAAQPATDAGVRGEAVASIAAPDGGRQVTYNRHPLYRYAGDQGAGRTAGHQVRDKWGHWRLMGINGEPISGQPESQPR